jgi:hypothetical protein
VLLASLATGFSERIAASNAPSSGTDITPAG